MTKSFQALFFSTLRRTLKAEQAVLLCLILYSPLSFSVSLSGVLDSTALVSSSETSVFPSVAQAFQAKWSYDGQQVRGEFTVAPGCYLYRDRFKIVIRSPQEKTLDSLVIPTGEKIVDPYLGGEHEIFREHVIVLAQVHKQPNNSAPSETLEIEVTWQGCAEAGLCYPSVHKTLLLSKTQPD